jgi:hypothetical protein
MAVEKLTFEMNAVGNAVPEMKKVQQQLGRVDKTMKQATGSMGRYTAANRNVARAQGNLTRNLGMASLQFQDIAVQASMGTNALRIMTMQGPQLASVFGPKGMIVGALIAVGGALAMMGDKTTKLTFDFKKLGKDIAPAFEPLKKLVMPIIETIGRAFTIVKNAIINSVNFMLNGISVLALTISKIPEFFKQAFDNAKMEFQLFRNLFKISFLAIQKFLRERLFKFKHMFADFTDSAAESLNRIFNTELRTDRAVEVLENFKNKTSEADAQLEALRLANQALITSLAEGNTAFDGLGKEIEDLVKLDITDYFKRIKKETDELANALTAVQQKTQSIADTMKTSMEDALMGIADRTKTVEDAFRAMATDIIRQLYRVLVVQQMVGSFDAATGKGTGIVGGIMGLFGKKAMGGPVSGGKAYMVGERGPEMIVPSRNSHVVPNNQLGGGGGVVVNQTINVTTGVQQTVRAEVMGLMPQIAEASKAAVLDAKRRGGAFGKAFS